MIFNFTYFKVVFIDNAYCYFITFVARDTSVSRETTQTGALYDVTVTLLTVLWTGYRTVLTVNSWIWAACDSHNFRLIIKLNNSNYH